MTAAPRPVTPLGILAATLQELAAEAGADPRLLRAAALADGLDPYVEAHTTPASNALAALDARTRAHSWAGGLEQEMLSGHVEGQLLRFLVRMSRALRAAMLRPLAGWGADRRPRRARRGDACAARRSLRPGVHRRRQGRLPGLRRRRPRARPAGPGRAHRRRQHPHAGPAVDG